MESARLTFPAAAKEQERLRAAMAPFNLELERINRPATEMAKQVSDYEKTDPTLNGTPHCGLDLLTWGKKLGELRDQEAVTREECALKGRKFSEQLLPLREKANLIERQILVRRKTLETALKLRAEHHTTSKLKSEAGLKEFVVKMSGKIQAELDHKGTPLSGWDEVFRHSGSRGGRPENSFATLKTLSLLHGLLSRDFGFPWKESPLNGLAYLMKRAQIRNVVEIGIGAYGMVNVLAHSGIAKAAGLTMHAIDIKEIKGTPELCAQQGIHYSVLDAKQMTPQHFNGDVDLIFAVGVLGRGGQEDHSLPTDRLNYVRSLASVREIVTSSMRCLNPHNPHAVLLSSSIRGLLCLERDWTSQNSTIEYWQEPENFFIQGELDRLTPRSVKYEATHGIKTPFDIETFIYQATELVALKRKS